MYSMEDLETLSYRELQKIAKARKIRQSGKGITKKKLVSILLDPVSESTEGDQNYLPLQELEVKLLHPVSSPEDGSFEQRSFFDVERELNDSNKENANRRRLTYDITEPQTVKPWDTEPEQRKDEIPPTVKTDEQKKTRKRVRIHETPKKDGALRTPKPAVKIIKTPVPYRKSSGKLGATFNFVNKTPASEKKTPRMNKTVALRLASSTKKTELAKKQSKIPKLDVRKPPNFANIHQNAFDKMDSLWDVEHQRVLRRRNAQSSRDLFTFGKETSKKRDSDKPAAKKSLPSTDETTTVKFFHQKDAVPITKRSALMTKGSARVSARQAANKMKPSKGNTMKEEQRTFLKGVRLNRRFQMQMQNRGLL